MDPGNLAFLKWLVYLPMLVQVFRFIPVVLGEALLICHTDT